MSKISQGIKYIYESPDGGNTVYAREFGKEEKTLIGKHYNSNDIVSQLSNGQLWYGIREMAKTNPALQKVMEHAILLYQLSKEHE